MKLHVLLKALELSEIETGPITDVKNGIDFEGLETFFQTMLTSLGVIGCHWQ